MSNKLNYALFGVFQAICWVCVGVGIAIIHIREQIGLKFRQDLFILTIMMYFVSLFCVWAFLHFYEKYLKEK